MSSKRKSRELALQVLFVWDAHNEASEATAEQVLSEMADPVTRQGGLDLARGAWGGRKVSDDWVERIAPQWPPRRQPSVDRGILRLAMWELTNTDTPPKVAIDEAIELAKIYSTENSPAFVNGVLDAVLKEIRELSRQ